jgi:hypothetical protein
MKYGFPFLAFCFCFSIALAQSTNATISGGVTDPSGNFIVNAEVEIANDATGIVYPAKTNGSGMYLVPILPPGHYHVQVSKPGFKTIIRADVVLNVQSALALNFTLPVGATSESVTVGSTSVPINSTDASVSTVVDRKFVENLPLNGRSFQDLISMTPGVVTQSPQARSQTGSKGDFSVNGQRTESNYYTVDGVSGNVSPGAGVVGTGGKIAAATALGTTQSLVSVDALQEFRVQSSTYSAEYGKGPGGQFSLVTRSGTNTPHGSVFDYLRNNYFDANNWFNDNLGVPIAPLRQNDFGGTYGAPVRIPRMYDGRNQTFFFFAYEGLRLTQPQAASVSYVPDIALRASAAPALLPLLSAFPVQNGKEEFVPCTTGASSTYPCPAGTPTGTLVESGLADFSESYALPSSIDSTSVRLDHTFGSRLAVFFRFGGTPSSTTARTLAEVAHTSNNTYTYTFGATSQIAKSVTNEMRLGYASADAASVYSLDSFGGATPTDANAAFGVPGNISGASTIMLLSFTGVGTTNWFVGQNESGTRSWNITDGVSILHGHHRIKTGIDFTRYNSLEAPSPAQAAAYYFSPGSIQNNQAATAYITRNGSASPLYYNTAFYAQDDWQATPRLGLSLGIRWELDPPPRDTNGNDAYTVLGDLSDPSSLALAPRGTALWKTYWYHFAPRLGSAWILHHSPEKETVVRAGGGVFFDTYGQVTDISFTGLGFSTTHTIGGSLPFASSLYDFSVAPSLPYTGLYAFPSHLQAPYTLQWNASVEQSFGRAQSVTISYVGANGRRLISAQSVSLQALNPNFGTIYEFPGGITSNYQALQAKFQRSVTRGIQALASYTWSHAIDYGSTYSAFGLRRGNSDFDVRHNFSAGASWDLPARVESKFGSALLGNWGIDGRWMARTGFPVNLAGNLLTDPATGNAYYSGVNLVPGKPIYLYNSTYPGRRAINGGPAVSAESAAFALPTGNNEGNAPRNFVRGFGENQVNLAVRRAFPIRDEFTLSFRAEAFNVLNHPNFGFINTTLTNAQFGLATQTLNQSLATLASQYQQGGPRSMQFALRLQF